MYFRMLPNVQKPAARVSIRFVATPVNNREERVSCRVSETSFRETGARDESRFENEVNTGNGCKTRVRE